MWTLPALTTGLQRTSGTTPERNGHDVEQLAPRIRSQIESRRLALGGTRLTRAPRVGGVAGLLGAPDGHNSCYFFLEDGGELA